MGTVQELIGVYDADGGIRGELAYLVGKLRGTRHCSLCDVTHSPIRRKRAWDELLARLSVPFRVLHLNERDQEVAALEEPAPYVAARIDGALQVILTSAQLERLDGSVSRFEAALLQGLSDRGFVLAA